MTVRAWLSSGDVVVKWQLCHTLCRAYHTRALIRQAAEDLFSTTVLLQGKAFTIP